MRNGATLASLTAASAIAAGLGGAWPAGAQDVLTPGGSLGSGSRPAYGAGTRVGNLRSQFEGLLGAGTASAPGGVAWRIIPSIGVDVGVTDNARRVTSPRDPDIFTQVSPGLLILGDTPRVNLNFSYTPLIQLYASTPGQNRLDHYLNAGAQVTVVPERFFIDARANVSQQSLTGGFGQEGAAEGTRSNFGRDDQVQTASVQVTPRFVNRFGSLGTAEFLYSFAYTNQSNSRDGRRGTAPLGSGFNSTFGPGFDSTFGSGNPNANPDNQGFFTQNLITHRERATFTTGEDFGRIRNFALLEAVQFDGAGPYNGAYRREGSVDTAFAVNRTLSLLGKIGYQQIRYTGTQGFRFDGITWNAGVRLTPNVEDFIELRYGQRDGLNDFVVDASYAPTARIRLLARYDTGVTSNAENQRNLLSGTRVDQFGGSVDALTGGPVGTTGGFFGTQNSLFEQRRLSLTGVYALPRDTVSLTLVREERSPVGNAGRRGAAGQAGTGSGTGFRGDSGIYGTVNWQHELAEDWRTNVSVQVGTRSANQVSDGAAGGEGSVSERTLSATAGTSYQLSETLSSQATYVFNQRTGGGGNRSFTENLLLVGLRKSF